MKFKNISNIKLYSEAFPKKFIEPGEVLDLEIIDTTPINDYLNSNLLTIVDNQTTKPAPTTKKGIEIAAIQPIDKQDIINTYGKAVITDAINNTTVSIKGIEDSGSFLATAKNGTSSEVPEGEFIINGINTALSYLDDTAKEEKNALLESKQQLNEVTWNKKSNVFKKAFIKTNKDPDLLRKIREWEYNPVILNYIDGTLTEEKS